MSTGGAIDLRLGDYREVMRDVDGADLLCCDPPYSDRTHDGARSADCFRRNNDKRADRIQNILPYERIDEDWVREFVSLWLGRVRHWWVLFGDHVSNRWWESALRDAGLQTFAPIPWIRTNAPPRFQGDGPQNSCEWIQVARPRRVVRDKGSRVGHYQHAIDARSQVVVGGKPLGLMRSLIRDYTRPGDTVADPTAGGATCLIAAALEGCRAIGAEIDPATHEAAMRRIEHGDHAAREPRQAALFGSEEPTP